jgi:hypothetical protein
MVRNFFAFLGCLTTVAVGGLIAWSCRDQIAGLYHSTVESRRAVSGADVTVGPVTGRASEAARRAAERKERAIADRDGPAYVVFTADEMAALIESRLDAGARRALDSFRVTLADDRVALEAALVTDVVGRDLLGPLGGFLEAREPLRLGGPARLATAGVLLWRPDEFVVRSLSVPPAAVPRLVDRLTGGDDGAFHIEVPSTVGDVRIRPDGVTLYRWVR